MAYTFQMHIHGVLMFVKEKDADRYDIIVPDTLMGVAGRRARTPIPPRTLAQDRTQLVRHAPSLSVGTATFDLDGQDIELDVGPARDGVGRDPTVDLLPRMERIAGSGDRCRLHDAMGPRGRGADRIVARMKIRQGTLTAVNPPPARDPEEAAIRVDGPFNISGLPPTSPTGSKGDGQKGLLSILVWTVEDIPDDHGIRVSLKPFDGGPGTTLTVAPPASGGTLAGGLMNHRADAEYLATPTTTSPDFRWYYRFVQDRDAIAKTYAGNSDSLPIPRMQMDQLMGIGGQNCHPCEFCP